MTIYYLASSDKPKDIFTHGFSNFFNTPSTLLNKNDAEIKNAIKKASTSLFPKIFLADEKKVLNLTKDFYSAPLYPMPISTKSSSNTDYTFTNVEIKELYIYIIDLEETKNIREIDEKVYSLYDDQLNELKEIILDHKANDKASREISTGYIANYLSYQSGVVVKIKPESIIAAFEIQRSSIPTLTAGLQVYTDGINYQIPAARSFITGSDLFINSKRQANTSLDQLVIRETMEKLNKHYNTRSLFDFIKEINQPANEYIFNLNSELSKQNKNVSSIEHAQNLLNMHNKNIKTNGDQISNYFVIPEPKTVSYFSYRFRLGHYFEAFMSVARSIFYGLKNVLSNFYNSLFGPKSINMQANKSIIEVGSNRDVSANNRNAQPTNSQPEVTNTQVRSAQNKEELVFPIDRDGIDNLRGVQQSKQQDGTEKSYLDNLRHTPGGIFLLTQFSAQQSLNEAYNGENNNIKKRLSR